MTAAAPFDACGEREPDRAPQTTNRKVDLGAQATARTANGLMFRPPFFGPRRVLVDTNHGGIDDQILKVRIIGHRLEYPPPYALRIPAAEAPEHAVPVSEHFGKIAPGRACPHYPENRFDR